MAKLKTHPIQNNGSSESTTKTSDQTYDDDPKDMLLGRRMAHKLSGWNFYNPSEGLFRKSVERLREKKTNNVENGVKVEDADNVKPPKLDDAWAYFEHHVLPRALKNRVPKNSDEAAEFDLGESLQYDRAEPGEFKHPTMLYPVWKTPIEEMGDFGIGVGLYFSTLRFFAIVTLIAGLVNIPNMMYFNDGDYTGGVKKHSIRSWLLKGSAVCSNNSWEYCPDCKRSDWTAFPSTDTRLATVSSVDGSVEDAYFIKKNKCEIDSTEFAVVILVTLLLLIGTVYYFVFSQGKRIKTFDDADQSSSDYTIEIKNIPRDAKDPEKWKQFFESKFDGVRVSACTIAIDNHKLIRALVRHRELLLKLENELPVGEKFDIHDLESVVQNCPAPTCMQRLFNSGADHLYAAICNERSTIEKLSNKEYNAVRAFVSFETEGEMREVLSAMSYPLLGNKRKIVRENFNYEGRLLKVKEPEEPTSVRWAQLGTSMTIAFLQQFLTAVILVVLIVGGGYVVSHAQSQSPLRASFAITFFNQVFPFIVAALTSLESHGSESTFLASKYFKITIFRWINTALITHYITPFTDTLQDGPYLIDSILILFIVTLLLGPTLQILDIFGQFKRHVLGPRQQDQRRMNLNFQGSEFDIAEKYTEVTKILFLTFWYSTLFPAAFFFASATLMLVYWVHKFSILRTWKQGAKIGTRISSFSNYFLLLTLVVYAVVMSYTYAQFPFDNACATGETIPDAFVGDLTATFKQTNGTLVTETITTKNDNTVHEYCNQNLLDITTELVFPPLPNQVQDAQWMTESQKSFANLFGWSCVLVCLFVAATFALTALKGFLKAIFCNRYQLLSEQDISEDKFSESPELYAYVPQLTIPGYTFPFLLCDVDGIDKDLVGWQDVKASYDEFNLIFDVPKVKEEKKTLFLKSSKIGSLVNKTNSDSSSSIFSIVKSWNSPSAHGRFTTTPSQETNEMKASTISRQSVLGVKDGKASFVDLNGKNDSI